MKKFLSLIIVLCVLLSVNLACSKKGKTNNSQLNTSNMVTTQSSVLENSNISQSSATLVSTISSISKNDVTTQNQTTFSKGSSQEQKSVSSSDSLKTITLNSTLLSSASSNSSSIKKVYSYVVDPAFCSEYISVQMFINEVEVFEAPIGEVVKFVITSADRVHYSIGYVSINGQVKFDVTDTNNYPNEDYKGRLEFEVPVTEGGFEIYIKVIWQNTTS